MKHVTFNDSAILQEFGRIMQAKDELKKTAQLAPVVPLTDDEKAKLQHFLGELQKTPSNGPGMEKWLARLRGQEDSYLKAVHDALAQRHALWAMGKDAQELTAVPLPTAHYAQKPLEQIQPLQHNSAANVTTKTAEPKCYDVTGKEDLVHEAHPQTAYVETDVVENGNEQQTADLEIAQKSAKEVLVVLYKLAKKLQAEKNDEAYKLVKDAFFEISGFLKSGK
jgi:hypothetical protein